MVGIGGHIWNWIKEVPRRFFEHWLFEYVVATILSPPVPLFSWWKGMNGAMSFWAFGGVMWLILFVFIREVKSKRKPKYSIQQIRERIRIVPSGIGPQIYVTPDHQSIDFIGIEVFNRLPFSITLEVSSMELRLEGQTYVGQFQRNDHLQVEATNIGVLSMACDLNDAQARKIRELRFGNDLALCPRFVVDGKGRLDTRSQSDAQFAFRIETRAIIHRETEG